jgi:hypothetical protein
MFTVLMVRDNLKDYNHPGDYPHPEGTVAEIVPGSDKKGGAK